MPSQGTRTAMLLGGALVATVASSASLNASANPQSDMAGASPMAVSFTEPGDEVANAPSLNLNVRPGNDGARFSELNRYHAEDTEVVDRRGVEFELGASHDLTGIPLDVSVAQRASFGASDGEIDRQSRGAEVRVGRALGDPRSGMTESQSRIYVFAASDDEALTWRPGASGSFAFQSDRVEIGDRQAGITYERYGMQASLAYVEREISAHAGINSHSDNEQFTGLTLTMRR